jgi:hypothetical protein
VRRQRAQAGQRAVVREDREVGSPLGRVGPAVGPLVDDQARVGGAEHDLPRRGLGEVDGRTVDQWPPEPLEVGPAGHDESGWGHRDRARRRTHRAPRQVHGTEALAALLGVGTDEHPPMVRLGPDVGDVSAVGRDRGRLVDLALDPLRLGVVAPPPGAVVAETDPVGAAACHGVPASGHLLATDVEGERDGHGQVGVGTAAGVGIAGGRLDRLRGRLLSRLGRRSRDCGCVAAVLRPAAGRQGQQHGRSRCPGPGSRRHGPHRHRPPSSGRRHDPCIGCREPAGTLWRSR